MPPFGTLRFVREIYLDFVIPDFTFFYRLILNEYF